jgi:hypothetical protein
VASERTLKEARDYLSGDATPEVVQRAEDGESELCQYLEGIRPPFRGKELGEARAAISAAVDRHRRDLTELLSEAEDSRPDATGRATNRDAQMENDQEG